MYEVYIMLRAVALGVRGHEHWLRDSEQGVLSADISVVLYPLIDFNDASHALVPECPTSPSERMQYRGESQT